MTKKHKKQTQTGTDYKKIVRKYRRLLKKNEPIAMVFIAFSFVVSLYTFEAKTGISASISEPMYGIQVSSMMQKSAVDDNFKFRLCDRVEKRFSDDTRMWDRVMKRVKNRFGFVCAR